MIHSEIDIEFHCAAMVLLDNWRKHKPSLGRVKGANLLGLLESRLEASRSFWQQITRMRHPLWTQHCTHPGASSESFPWKWKWEWDSQIADCPMVLTGWPDVSPVDMLWWKMSIGACFRMPSPGDVEAGIDCRLSECLIRTKTLDQETQYFYWSSDFVVSIKEDGSMGYMLPTVWRYGRVPLIFKMLPVVTPTANH